MEAKRKFVHFEALLFAAVMSLCLPSHVFANESDQSDESGTARPARLVGTWEVSVSTPNGLNPSLVTINADNTMTESSVQDLHPPVSSPGHGVWAHTKGNHYAFSLKFFIVDATGNLVCTAKIRQTIILDRDADEWSGPARIDCVDPNGNELFGGDLSATATRMRLAVL